MFRGRLLSFPEQLLQVTDLKKAIVVHRVPVLRDFLERPQLRRVLRRTPRYSAASAIRTYSCGPDITPLFGGPAEWSVLR